MAYRNKCEYVSVLLAMERAMDKPIKANSSSDRETFILFSPVNYNWTFRNETLLALWCTVYTTIFSLLIARGMIL